MPDTDIPINTGSGAQETAPGENERVHEYPRAGVYSWVSVIGTGIEVQRIRQDTSGWFYARTDVTDQVGYLIRPDGNWVTIGPGTQVRVFPAEYIREIHVRIQKEL